MKSYKELEIWQKSINLSVDIYSLANKLPTSEKYNLSTQMIRCSISIPSNIAESWGRESTKEFIRFLKISRGSLFELETQLIIANKIRIINSDLFSKFQNDVKSIGMMLNKLISKIK